MSNSTLTLYKKQQHAKIQVQCIKDNLKYLKTMHFLNAHYFCLIWCNLINTHNQLKSNKNNTTPSRCKQILCIQSKE